MYIYIYIYMYARIHVVHERTDGLNEGSSRTSHAYFSRRARRTRKPLRLARRLVNARDLWGTPSLRDTSWVYISDVADYRARARTDVWMDGDAEAKIESAIFFFDLFGNLTDFREMYILGASWHSQL